MLTMAIYTPTLDGFAAVYALWLRMGHSINYRPLHPSDDYGEGWARAYGRFFLIGVTLDQELIDKWTNAGKIVRVIESSRSLSMALHAWEMTRGNSVKPENITRVHDAVTGTLSMQDTRAYIACLMRYPQRFDVWKLLEEHTESTLEIGRACLSSGSNVDLDKL